MRRNRKKEDRLRPRMHKPHPSGKRFAIVRGEGNSLEYWNDARRVWIPTAQIHGGSAQNPKASYFTFEMAMKTLILMGTKSE